MPVLEAGVPAVHSWLIMAAAWVVLELAGAEPGSRDAPLQAAVDSRAVAGSTRLILLADGVADLVDGAGAGVADSADLEEGLVSEDSDAGLALVLAADSAGGLVFRFSA